MKPFFWVGFACLMSVSAAPDAYALGRGRGQELSTIQAAKDVPAWQMDQLRKDFQWLATLESSNTNPELLRVMALEQASAQHLSVWLSDRVRFLLSESFEPTLWSVLPFFFKRFEFPNPGVFPELEGQNRQSVLPQLHESRSAKVVMANLGTALYLSGKMSDVVMGVRVKGVGRLPVTSPRLGVIQVGEGLFYSGYFGKDLAPESPVRSAFRMATFFHEARHSDGNGKTLGFLHAICPRGHDYEGLGACDRNLNGPYTVGALMEEHMAAHCSKCSEAERETLRVMALESRSRVITQRDGTPAENWDPSPEGQVEL